MKVFPDGDVIGALRQCANKKGCSECPLLGRRSIGYLCMKETMNEAADLIERKCEQVEELTSALIESRAKEYLLRNDRDESASFLKNAISMLDTGGIGSAMVKEFAKYLVDKAEDGTIDKSELPDLVVDFLKGAKG